MDTFTYWVQSAKGIPLETLYKEIISISKEDGSLIQLKPTLNSVKLVTSNIELLHSLIKNKDYILKTAIDFL